MKQLNMMSGNSLGSTNRKLKKTLEKLSSGIRINRAGDGPAELAVSQAMRADIIELDRTQKNAEDGISLVMTAEGALAEVHDMLDRLIELSGQAANGIYVESDRESLQHEVSQLKSEIDRIAATTEFNGIPLLDGSLAGVEGPVDGPGDAEVVQVFRIEKDATGVEPKNAVQEGASWEGEIDFSKVYNGTTLTINGVTFEFNTDGVQNDPGAINVSCTPGNSGSAAAALEASILGSSLADDLDSCTVASTGAGDTYKIKLTQKNTSAENGKGFMFSAGTSIPQVEYSTAELKGTPGAASSRLEINDVKLDSIVDGTIIEYFGNKYELDFDGVCNSSHTALDLSGGTKISKLKNALYSLNPNATVSLVGGSTVGYYRFQIKYKNTYTTPSISDFSFNPTSYPTPGIHVTQNKSGIVTPPVLPQKAARTDEVDFSLFQDGDSITIQGKTFEFDADGILGDSSHIAVDMSAITAPSDMAAALKTAFDSSGLTGLTMTTAAVNGNTARIKVSAASPVQEEKIEFEYKVARTEEKEEDEMEGGGLTLKIGPGKEGELCVKLESMTTEALGISSVSVNTQEDASKAMKLIHEAVNHISKQRGTLGEIHNHLEHTINNLGVSMDNLTAAESRIRDANMAGEMAELVKLQILQQSTHSVMAQSQNVMKNQVQQLLQL